MTSDVFNEWEARGERIPVNGLDVFVVDAPATGRGDR